MSAPALQTAQTHQCGTQSPNHPVPDPPVKLSILLIHAPTPCSDVPLICMTTTAIFLPPINIIGCLPPCAMQLQRLSADEFAPPNPVALSIT